MCLANIAELIDDCVNFVAFGLGDACTAICVGDLLEKGVHELARVSLRGGDGGHLERVGETGARKSGGEIGDSVLGTGGTKGMELGEEGEGGMG